MTTVGIQELKICGDCKGKYHNYLKGDMCWACAIEMDDPEEFIEYRANRFDDNTNTGTVYTKEHHQLTADKRPCKWYAMGTCKFGQDCDYSHATPVVSRPSASVCIFYLQNRCKKGKDCTFVHTRQTSK